MDPWTDLRREGGNLKREPSGLKEEGGASSGQKPQMVSGEPERVEEGKAIAEELGYGEQGRSGYEETTQKRA